MPQKIISKFCKYLYIKEGNNATSWEPKFDMLRSVLDCKFSYNCDIALYKKKIYKKKNCPQSQIIENIYVCERALKIYEFTLHIIMHNAIQKV